MNQINLCKVIVRGLSQGKGLNRFVEKKVEQWINAHTKPSVSGAAVADDPIFSYSVLIEQEVPHHLVACKIEVQLEDSSWSSFEIAPTAELAVSRGLQHLKRIPEAGFRRMRAESSAPFPQAI